MSIKKFKDHIVNESKSVSEIETQPPIQNQFNNKQYIKGYKSQGSAWMRSTEINQTQFRIGDRVEVDMNENKHGGKIGHIGVGFSKDNPLALKVVFEDGKSGLVDKTFLQKIADEF